MGQEGQASIRLARALAPIYAAEPSLLPSRTASVVGSAESIRVMRGLSRVAGRIDRGQVRRARHRQDHGGWVHAVVEDLLLRDTE